ncbi:MAG TPA: pyridoxamine 5'-phosphate oxidase family protein [Pyrinomonadaceae bacterium]|nr:pyridoxamine 5'-phosphate oxidase family protein [Pyrinomonadaceae bacterium]
MKSSARTRVKRLPARGAYDRETIYSILDAGFICHVGYVMDGQPYVIPTGYARIGDDLYIHGSSASRMLRNLAEGIDVCITVTLVDGLVLARSAFHHSINYRSVVVLGKAVLVEDAAEKDKALEAFTEHIIPGRWPEIRWPNELELKATSVLKLPIEEASAKIRTGDPKDDDEDYAMSVWAGVVPLEQIAGDPIPDSKLDENIEPPPYLTSSRPK